MRSYIFLFVFLFFLGGYLGAQEEGIKEEVRLDEKGIESKKDKRKNKKISVFEIINKLLRLDVEVKGRKLTRDQKDDLAKKVEGSVKDCVSKILIEREEYQRRDKKLFNSDWIVKIKMTHGTFEEIKVLKSKTKSPFMHECISSLKEFETGYNLNAELKLRIKTKID
ncbi:MAG: hypothetical protein N2746_07680 [Deltaproteobacteria bacterium]|nr:hypothetical protein [Deltaproteobacteria bacterium]